MHKNTYVFRGRDIHQLAAELSQALETRLYPLESPMIGPWYSSEDLAAVIEVLKESKGYVEPARCFELLLNEREPGTTGPAFPVGDCHLLVWAGEEDFDEIEEALRNLGRPFERLGAEEASR